jgi:acetoacetyl-[acyl-carrier protein] synthase
VEQAAQDYDQAMDRGEIKPIYQFGEGVLHGEDLAISREQIAIPGFGIPVNLELDDPYPDMS